MVTEATTRLIECDWTTSWSLPVTTATTTGIYAANLTDLTSDRESQIWFVVRDDSSESDIVFGVPFSNYLAYNHYGTEEQRSLYEFNSTGEERAYKVSFDRLWGQTTTEQEAYNNMIEYDYLLARWLESQGYDVSYLSNIDVEVDPTRLLKHQLYISPGHDEHWSLTMRDAVEVARDAGVNLAFLSANTAYWRVRYEDSSAGQPNRVMACYKNPLDSEDPVEPTYLWRGSENNRPENSLIGVMYTGDDVYNQFGGYDFVVTNDSHPYYANTGLTNGDAVFGLVGYEWDGIVNNGFTPAGIEILA